MTQIQDIDVWLEDLLTGLLECANLDIWVAELYYDEEYETYTVQLDGPDKGLIIGRDGQVLDALQHFVVSASANAAIPRKRIVIDVDDYRIRRDEKLMDNAERLAEETVSTNTPCDLEPMCARDRRLVHMAVSNVEGVSTESIGHGDERFVRLIPTP